ncbi:EPTC-inducible aldehyde dehydrogenase [Streptomyces sp. MBT84]|nr:EPTC-inducible aldehyde dehydrogenase [Streptomyces sp. MBT84]
MTRYAAPGSEGAIVSYQAHYDHFIGGEYVPPARGQYFENPSPVNGQPFTEIARGTSEDVERALDAAHAAAPAWGRTSVTERSDVLRKIADRMEANLEQLAVAESWENGKPVRETMAADIPSPSTTSATSRGRSGGRRVRWPSSTTTRWRTTSTSRSAWWRRSSRGTSRS